MTSKITISTTEQNAHLLSQLSIELGMKKNEVFDKALNYFSDMVETSVINRRLNSIKDGNSKILTLDEFYKATE